MPIISFLKKRLVVIMVKYFSFQHQEGMLTLDCHRNRFDSISQNSKKGIQECLLLFQNKKKPKKASNIHMLIQDLVTSFLISISNYQVCHQEIMSSLLKLIGMIKANKKQL